MYLGRRNVDLIQHVTVVRVQPVDLAHLSVAQPHLPFAHEEPVGPGTRGGDRALDLHRRRVHKKDLLGRRDGHPHVVVVYPLHPVGARDSAPIGIAEDDDALAGGVVAFRRRAVPIELEQLAAVGRGDPQHAVPLGHAAGVLRSRRQVLDHRAVVPAQLVEMVVRLVDHPEAVVGRLKSVWLGAGRDPHIVNLRHSRRLLRGGVAPILTATPADWKPPLSEISSKGCAQTGGKPALLPT